MTSSAELSSQAIWATRGKTWGFRFLFSAGLPDPHPTYLAAFSGRESEHTSFARLKDGVCIRFEDPLQRRDSASRIIPHDFVVFGPLATRITSFESAIAELWPLVENIYVEIWDQDTPPASGLHLDPQS